MEQKAYYITAASIESYQNWLVEEEKSANTIEKYVRDLKNFYNYLPESKEITKKELLNYKAHLTQRYSVRSMNSMLVALNCYMSFIGCREFKVKLAKCQRGLFCAQETELSREEYYRLIKAAAEKGNRRLGLLIECICSTGIRVSELAFITVEAAHCGQAEISLKGKTRRVFLPQKLCKKLLDYIRAEKIESGYIFRTTSGKPMDRSNIWKNMKALCKAANVNEAKVFPHNLRHLFARLFYQIEKDIVRLADILGHSSIDTTRIYMVSTGEEHVRKLEMMRLVV